MVPRWVPGGTCEAMEGLTLFMVMAELELPGRACPALSGMALLRSREAFIGCWTLSHCSDYNLWLLRVNLACFLLCVLARNNLQEIHLHGGNSPGILFGVRVYLWEGLSGDVRGHGRPS